MLIDRAIEYVTHLFENDFSGHDAQHTLRVYHLATQIARQEGADLLTVQLSALLHDVDDMKLSPQTHAGQQNAMAFMQSNHVDANMIAVVCRIIGEVSFAGTDSVVPASIEGKCVQDADRLDAIGAIGIARTFAYGGSRGRKIYDPDIPPILNMNREQYQSNQSSPSINHFYEKLLLLKDMLNTDAARQIAAHRHAVMECFLDEFMAEWRGER